MVERLAAGEWDVPAFERAFYDFYLESVPEAALTEREQEFFGLLQERLDWTASEPDSESRRYGWQNYAEYRAWARDLLARFRSGATLSILRPAG
jgi:hypothetical protein